MALPPIITPALLSSLRRHPHLPRNTWPLIAATALSALNRPDEIPKVYTHALEHGLGPQDAEPGAEEQLSISRRVREALVKSASISGLPKAINALLSLKSATPEHLLDDPGTSPTSRAAELNDTPPAQILRRGQTFFDGIYGRIARRVMGRLDHCGTEDLGVAARVAYGYGLSNVSVLSGVETSFVLIAGLIPQDVKPQLKGHLRGALNGGATVEEVKAVREITIRICEAAGMRRIGEDEPGGWGWRTEVADV